ncbi:translation initiation factor IF-2 [Rickettsiales bacterium]|nr:translation initiation factor IF-2 [Rickettsiales bacterium]
MTDLEDNNTTTNSKKGGLLKLCPDRKISLTSSRLPSHGNSSERRGFAVVRKRGRPSSSSLEKSPDDQSSLTDGEAQARLDAFQKAAKLHSTTKDPSSDKEQDNASRMQSEENNTSQKSPQEQSLDSPQTFINAENDSSVANTNRASKTSDNIKDETEVGFRGKPRKGKLQQDKAKNITRSDWKKVLDSSGEDEGLNSRQIKSPPKARKKARAVFADKQRAFPTKKLANTVIYSDGISVTNLASQMKEKVSKIIKFLNQLDIKCSAKDAIDYETAELVVNEFRHQIKKSSTSQIEESFDEAFMPSDQTLSRPPVVTIMGHVDHGKTSLLDAIRHSNVTNLESGGITQHIGAYQTKTKDDQCITFIDTPGHAAFTAMRARGAKVTDVVVLVVAADDGIMEQTVEAINHIKAASVPVIVAINKIDKPGADVSKAINALTSYDLVPEEYGGDVLVVPVSAKEKKNIDKLKEVILLQAEIMELGCDPQRRACGVVLESRVVQNRGVLVSLLVQNGTLKVGDFIVAGTVCGRIRVMFNDQGERIKEAPPSAPVEVMGVSFVSEAGERFAVFADEKAAKELVEHRVAKQNRSQTNISATDFKEMLDSNQEKESLSIVLKADTQGSIEAITAALLKLSNEDLKINIAHSAVGAVSESDVILAYTSGAKISAFNVGVDINARALLKKYDLDVDSYSVIYDLLDHIESLVKGAANIVQEQKYIGSAVVRKVFNISKVGKIAGCYVTDGLIRKDAIIKLLRDGIVIHEGDIKTLRRFKENVKEVGLNFECGLAFDRYSDIKENDIIQAFGVT